MPIALVMAMGIVMVMVVLAVHSVEGALKRPLTVWYENISDPNNELVWTETKDTIFFVLSHIYLFVSRNFFIIIRTVGRSTSINLKLNSLSNANCIGDVMCNANCIGDGNGYSYGYGGVGSAQCRGGAKKAPHCMIWEHFRPQQRTRLNWNKRYNFLCT